jgi:acetylornithine deacetylase/succinyl-diaminopimelate desuccinylase-like protein
VNSVPFEATMDVDMRSEDPASLDRIDGVFKEAMRRGLADENAMRRRGAPLELKIEQVGNRPSGAVPDDHSLVQRARRTAEIFAGTSELGISSTNSNIPISLGVPAVTIGRGGVGGETHAPGEWWLNRDGHLAIQRALLLLVSEAGLDVERMQP